MKYSGVSILFFCVAIVGVGFFVYTQHNITPPNPTSTLVLSPTPTSSTKIGDPTITDWSTYKNDTYNFSISVPNLWNQQEYKSSDGNFLVAFSPNTLPCPTCTYIHDGYFSIKIFNQKTDPQSYLAYTQKKQNVGKSKADIPMQLVGKTAIMNGSMIDLETNGNVYEFSLDKDNGQDLVTDSQIFQKVVLSLQFTTLQFNY